MAPIHGIPHKHTATNPLNPWSHNPHRIARITVVRETSWNVGRAHCMASVMLPSGDGLESDVYPAAELQYINVAAMDLKTQPDLLLSTKQQLLLLRLIDSLIVSGTGVGVSGGVSVGVSQTVQGCKKQLFLPLLSGFTLRRCWGLLSA